LPELPVRARCTPPNSGAVSKARAAGQSWRDIWVAYAERAERPYGFTWFQKIALAKASPVEDAIDAFAESETYWEKRLSPVSKTLGIAEGGALRVKGGQLQIHDAGKNRHFTQDGHKPQALVFMGWGGLVTLEATRWCSENHVAIVALDWTHGLLSFVHGAPKAEAALVRAQCSAEALRIARELISKKITHSHSAGCLTATEVKALQVSLRRAATVADINRVEASAAILYWDRRQIELKSRRGPLLWPMFVRRKVIFKGVRNARHPVNAVLNLAYSITAGRLGVHLAARGACLAIGFLHVDKGSRNSLVWDAIEPLRPLIDARAFAFLKKSKFSRGDFIKLSDGLVRLTPTLARHVAAETALPDADIDQAVEFILRLILSP
jgi:CRISP-associated protein Cas1